MSDSDEMADELERYPFARQIVADWSTTQASGATGGASDTTGVE